MIALKGPNKWYWPFKIRRCKCGTIFLATIKDCEKRITYPEDIIVRCPFCRREVHYCKRKFGGKL